MLLRESGEQEGRGADPRAVVDADADSDVPAGGALLRLASAVVRGDEGELEAARRDVREALGDAALVDALAVASNFERMVRIADGAGIELGRWLEEGSRAVREELGLERLRHG